jgi:uncharacterized protein (DUF2062 family)
MKPALIGILLCSLSMSITVGAVVWFLTRMTCS